VLQIKGDSPASLVPPACTLVPQPTGRQDLQATRLPQALMHFSDNISSSRLVQPLVATAFATGSSSSKG
jgi:hypothetical protein